MKKVTYKIEQFKSITIEVYRYESGGSCRDDRFYD